MSDTKKILHLTLTKRWFAMIAFEIKGEEYREISDHWNKRLVGKSYDEVHFRNGYHPTDPEMRLVLNSIFQGQGNPHLGAPKHDVHIIRLGDLLMLDWHGKDPEIYKKLIGL